MDLFWTCTVIPKIGVWPSIFFGIGISIVIGLLSNMFPIYWMNIHDCWSTQKCGDGSHGTILFVAKWYGTIAGAVLGTFCNAFVGPAIAAMTSMQVKQTEQASVQAAFGLVAAVAQVSHFLVYQAPACSTDPLTILTADLSSAGMFY